MLPISFVDISQGCRNWWCWWCHSTTNICQFSIDVPLLAPPIFWPVKYRTIVAPPIFHTLRHPCNISKIWRRILQYWFALNFDLCGLWMKIFSFSRLAICMKFPDCHHITIFVHPKYREPWRKKVTLIIINCCLNFWVAIAALHCTENVQNWITAKLQFSTWISNLWIKQFLFCQFSLTS